MPGGMGGMPGMGGVPPGMAGMAQGMMNDPDVMAAMSNPKVMAAFQEMMAGGAPNPAKMMQYMQDPGRLQCGRRGDVSSTRVGGRAFGSARP